MSEDWRNQPATDEQKGKLRFFGCTWDDGITAGQADDALEDCARQFPAAEADYQNNLPATEKQKEKLKFFGCTWNGDITIGKASDALEECAREFPDKEADWQFQKKKWSKVSVSLERAATIKTPTVETPQQYLERTGRANDPAWKLWAKAKQIPPPEITIQKTETVVSVPSTKREALSARQTPLTYDEARVMTQEGWHNWIALYGSYGTEPGQKLTFGEARGLSEKAWDEWRIQHGRLSTRENIERQKKETAASPPAATWCSQCRKSKLVEHNGRYWCPDCGRLVTPLDHEIVVRLNLQISSTQEIDQRAGEPEPPFYLKYSLEPYLPVEFQQTEAENRRRYEKYLAAMERWNSQQNDGAKKQPEPFPEPPKPQNLNPREFAVTDNAAPDFGQNRPSQNSAPSTEQDWRNAPATVKQKEKLRALGGKFDEGITVGIAKLLIEHHKNLRTTASAAPEKSEVGLSQRVNIWDKWFKKRQSSSYKTPSKEVTIQEAAKPQNSSPREIIPEAPKDLRQHYEMFCPACGGQIDVPSGTVGKIRTCPNCKAEVTPVFFKKTASNNFVPARVTPNYAQPRSAIQKPATYISNVPIERFTKWLDIVLERNNKCLGGHWLPVGHVFYPFREYTTLTKGLCCQIADAIESRGYCVEPDARFGSGKYEKLDTLALFKSFDGDPIHPSTAYLGAANLLRLCILITTADGQIDLVELEVFRQAIENLPGLSLTDHKRLLILEQLLVQELSLASKTAAKIARSVPADKRLVIGKLLVEVAAANNFITDGERRVLEDVFKLLKIRHDTLEKFINEICPWPQRDVVQNDVSEGDRQLWNQWRIDHPGIVIDDSTLTEMKWNFNDWKALDARWRDLHDKLAARKEQSRTAPEASSQKVSVLETFLAAGRRLGIRGKKIPEPIAMPAPKGFALDPDKIYAIQNDTKEVTAILSIVMEDEPEKLIAPSATITLPAPEIPKVSSDANASPQPTRFNGLDAAFHPVLERLLARDSWPQKDFKSLADEFHFMPLNIRDTLNEWADEKLGDFILDGEDPVVIRRELIAKEKVYG